MLKSLHIQNYALIETLHIDFERGFSVITGETGAGKSILLGAIGLLLGQRADAKTIKAGATKCVIEAYFDIDGYGLNSFFDVNELEFDAQECILRRELSNTGKSRAFINDTPVPLTLMKELGDQLIDVHSQHQNLLLNKEGFQLNVLDIMAHNSDRLIMYTRLFQGWQQLRRELQNCEEEAEKNRADEDYYRFQLEQLEEAKLTAGEQEALEQEAEMLNHAEEIKSGLYKVEQTLAADEDGLVGVLKMSMNTLQHLQDFYAPAAELLKRMESSYIELKDLGQEISNIGENIEFQPDRLDQINERLNLFYTLQQKHHVTDNLVLMEQRELFRQKLNAITSYEERIEQLRASLSEQYNKVCAVAAELTVARKKAAQNVENQMVDRLVTLGMPNVRFKVEMEARKEVGPHGADSVNFLFSANKSGSLQNLSTVASGGEIARVMLSVKAIIATAVKLPTIIFDEIDTGVSGEIADRMATIMQAMGAKRQVISITHLPQIAARGCAHYWVYKEDNDTATVSRLRRLNEQERVEELARMLSGATLTEAALNNAKELLKTNK